MFLLRQQITIIKLDNVFYAAPDRGGISNETLFVEAKGQFEEIL